MSIQMDRMFTVLNVWTQNQFAIQELQKPGDAHSLVFVILVVKLGGVLVSGNKCRLCVEVERLYGSTDNVSSEHCRCWVIYSAVPDDGAQTTFSFPVMSSVGYW